MVLYKDLSQRSKKLSLKVNLKKMSLDSPLQILPLKPVVSHKYIYAATERTNS